MNWTSFFMGVLATYAVSFAVALFLVGMLKGGDRER